MARRSDAFANVALVASDGRRLRFVDDLVRDRCLLVNFFYTHCDKSCPPATQNLIRVHHLLRARVGRDLSFVSVTLDPERDTPERLAEHAERLGSRRAWHFLTGAPRDLDALRKSLGVYDPDPVVDADRSQHASLATFGSDRTGRWGALSALIEPVDLARAVLRAIGVRET
jgi:protein SCO1/2